MAAIRADAGARTPPKPRAPAAAPSERLKPRLERREAAFAGSGETIRADGRDPRGCRGAHAAEASRAPNHPPHRCRARLSVVPAATLVAGLGRWTTGLSPPRPTPALPPPAPTPAPRSTPTSPAGRRRWPPGGGR